MIRPHRVVLAATLALTLATSGGAGTAAAAPIVPALPGSVDRSTALAWTADTWRSMVAMVDPNTGLPADNISGDLSAASRSKYTSPTNIGAYIWSTIVARKLHVIGEVEQVARIRAALDSLARLERHAESGMYYNWYDPATLQLLRVWPDDGSTVYPFASSVDNAWLAAALMIVHNAVPELRAQADPLLAAMDFAFFYNPTARGPDVPVGLMYGGFWVQQPPGYSCPQEHKRGVYYTCHTYGAFNSETRIISYVAISRGQVPPAHYFAPWRTFPDTCDWSWQEMKPVGVWREYLGIPVFEGAYRYPRHPVTPPVAPLQFVPTWGGDMFEALMPDMFVPEAQWGPNSFGRNHPVYVRGQIVHGMNDARYGHWGFSPASNPAGGYREYGVDAMGLDGPGYTSDQERTSIDYGFEGCRPAQPVPTAYGDGVVTPHAVFLAMQYAPAEAVAELGRLRAQFDIYGPGGFYDAVAVRSGTVAKRYLALDQGMVMGALGNLFGGDILRKEFTRGGPERLLHPVMRLEEFNVPAQQ